MHLDVEDVADDLARGGVEGDPALAGVEGDVARAGDDVAGADEAARGQVDGDVAVVGGDIGADSEQGVLLVDGQGLTRADDVGDERADVRPKNRVVLGRHVEDVASDQAARIAADAAVGDIERDVLPAGRACPDVAVDREVDVGGGVVGVDSDITAVCDSVEHGQVGSVVDDKVIASPGHVGGENTERGVRGVQGAERSPVESLGRDGSGAGDRAVRHAEHDVAGTRIGDGRSRPCEVAARNRKRHIARGLDACGINDEAIRLTYCQAAVGDVSRQVARTGVERRAVLRRHGQDVPRNLPGRAIQREAALARSECDVARASRNGARAGEVARSDVDVDRAIHRRQAT